MFGLYFCGCCGYRTLLQKEVPLTKFLSYASIGVITIIAIVGLVFAATDRSSTWDKLALSVDQIGAASNLAQEQATVNHDFTICAASASVSAISKGISESLNRADKGVCEIPAVTVDISPCLAFSKGPTHAEGRDVDVFVKASIAPISALLQSAVTHSDTTDGMRAWTEGVNLWLSSGVPSIIALIENPGTGKLHFDAEVIEDCKPVAK